VKQSEAPLALMEQMIMLLVFALAAALCLQAFVHSDTESRRSEARDKAALLCQSAAESLSHTGGDFAALPGILGLPDGTYTQEDALLEIYYSDSWTPSGEYAYCLRASLADCGQKGLGGADVKVVEAEDGEELFALRVNWQTEVDGNG